MDTRNRLAFLKTIYGFSSDDMLNDGYVNDIRNTIKGPRGKFQ